MRYKPTDRFNANTKMIEDILKDILKDIGGPAGKVSYALCILVKGDNEKDENFAHVVENGDLKRTSGILFGIAEKLITTKIAKRWGLMPDS